VEGLARDGVAVDDVAIYYRSRAGVWDGIAVSAGQCVGFYAVQATTVDAAVRAVALARERLHGMVNAA
jgi:hypothetical protein